MRWYHYPELADRETLLQMLRAGLSDEIKQKLNL